jgi:hypothetical protein
MSILWGIVAIWVLANVAFAVYVVCFYLWTESGRGPQGRLGHRPETRAGPVEPSHETIAR